MAEQAPPEKITRSETVELEVPKSWWEAWKLEHSNKWYAKWIVSRWPVVMKTLSEKVTLNVSLKGVVKYPEYRESFSKTHGKGVRTFVLGERFEHERFADGLSDMAKRF